MISLSTVAQLFPQVAAMFGASLIHSEDAPQILLSCQCEHDSCAFALLTTTKGSAWSAARRMGEPLAFPSLSAISGPGTITYFDAMFNEIAVEPVDGTEGWVPIVAYPINIYWFKAQSSQTTTPLSLGEAERGGVRVTYLASDQHSLLPATPVVTSLVDDETVVHPRTLMRWEGYLTIWSPQHPESLHIPEVLTSGVRLATYYSLRACDPNAGPADHPLTVLVSDDQPDTLPATNPPTLTEGVTDNG